MGTDRIKQRLNSVTSKKSSNTNTYLKIELEGKEKLLPPDELTHIVSAGVQFDTERQASTFYRILGTIKPIISNVLFKI